MMKAGAAPRWLCRKDDTMKPHSSLLMVPPRRPDMPIAAAPICSRIETVACRRAETQVITPLQPVALGFGLLLLSTLVLMLLRLLS
ncbi:MAG: hypothetical protein EA400_05290 [Chromatiaceae bacterium]|nr:MAG: hypothetical protein EA400_05290 [Chromatiaceae bacterium]